MKFIINFTLGACFGIGLILTGMYSPDVILSGLKIGATSFSWNLYVTFACALVVSFLIYRVRYLLAKPWFANAFQLPTKNKLDWQLYLGALIFGLGWGISGICPGPNVVGLGLLAYPFYWLNFIFILFGFAACKWVLETRLRVK